MSPPLRRSVDSPPLPTSHRQTRPSPGRGLMRAEHPAPGRGLMPTPVLESAFAGSVVPPRPRPRRRRPAAPAAPTPPRLGTPGRPVVGPGTPLPVSSLAAATSAGISTPRPRRHLVGADESSIPRTQSAAPAAAADLSPATKKQQTWPRNPETAGPRQVERPKGYSS